MAYVNNSFLIFIQKTGKHLVTSSRFYNYIN